MSKVWHLQSRGSRAFFFPPILHPLINQVPISTQQLGSSKPQTLVGLENHSPAVESTTEGRIHKSLYDKEIKDKFLRIYDALSSSSGYFTLPQGIFATDL